MAMYPHKRNSRCNCWKLWFNDLFFRKCQYFGDYCQYFDCRIYECTSLFGNDLYWIEFYYSRQYFVYSLTASIFTWGNYFYRFWIFRSIFADRNFKKYKNPTEHYALFCGISLFTPFTRAKNSYEPNKSSELNSISVMSSQIFFS